VSRSLRVWFRSPLPWMSEVEPWVSTWMLEAEQWASPWMSEAGPWVSPWMSEAEPWVPRWASEAEPWERLSVCPSEEESEKELRSERVGASQRAPVSPWEA
jgi:hypothetical protein